MFHFVHCMFDCKHGRLLDLSNNTLVDTLSSLPALPATLTYVCGAMPFLSCLSTFFVFTFTVTFHCIQVPADGLGAQIFEPWDQQLHRGYPVRSELANWRSDVGDEGQPVFGSFAH